MAAEITVSRGSTVIRRFFLNEGRPSIVVVDQPSAGTHTYTVHVGRSPQGGGTVLNGSVGDRTLVLTIHKV